MNKKIISLAIIFIMLFATGLSTILAAPAFTSESDAQKKEQEEESTLETPIEGVEEDQPESLKDDSADLGEPLKVTSFENTIEFNVQPATTAITFESQFADPYTAQVIADYFGKNISEEIDDTVKNTQYIKIDFKNLKSIEGFGIFTELEYLYLEHNSIREIPADFSNLKNLKQLSFNHNLISEIPVELFENKQLEKLSFYNNKLASVPSQIGQLENLVELDLGTNLYLDKLPSDFAKLTSLKKLFLNGNSFSDSFGWMEIVSQLTNIEYLDLGVNQIINVSPDFKNLNKLNHLDLRNNKIVKLPNEFKDIPNLKYIYLNENQLTSLPDNFIDLNNKLFLELDGNLLPSSYADELNSKGMRVSGNPFIYKNQDQLKLLNGIMPINIVNQSSIDNVNYASMVKLTSGRALSSAHEYKFVNFKDENNNAIDFNDYIQNGVVQKNGKVFAQVRATGTGLFPNNSDHALTSEFVELNFQMTHYNLTFDLNGATGSTYSMQTLIEGAKATSVAEPTRDGYDFKGWNTKAGGDGTAWDFNNSTMPANDVTLFAQWQAKTTSTPISTTPNNETPITTQPNVNSATYEQVTDTVDQNINNNYQAQTTQAPNSNAGKVEDQSDEINANKTPLGNLLSREHWALANLIIALLGGILSLVMFIGFFIKKDNKKQADEKKKQSKTWKIASIVLGSLAIIIFILTQDMSDPMVIFDLWTPVMAVIAAAQIASVVMTKAKRRNNSDEKSSQLN